MKKKFSSVLLTLVILAMTVSPLTATVMAKNPVVTEEEEYTQYVGTLDGANFVVRIPKEGWNGMLVVGCHGYMDLPPETWSPDAQFQVDTLLNGEAKGLPFVLVEEGFAYAASSYGEGGWPIKKAMIHTHQLTEYVINNYGVTGKVFIVGHSMGGLIGLALGEKYPELYDGVLDISGMKDVILGYTELVALIPNLPPPVQPIFLAFKADIEAEYGGTYDEKPKAYERTNPTSNAEISIPMISVNGAQDILMSPDQAVSYENAVAEAGCSEYYRLYTAAEGGHADPPTIDEALSHFEELVNYPTGW